jgi:hypothetical protein
MSFAARQLFELLPAILRIRDQSRAVVTPGLLDSGDRAVLADLEAKDAANHPLTGVERQHLDQLRRSSLAGPLASLLAVLAEQVAVLQEDLDQLYDDQFIETCAEWVAPYIGDLVGYRALHGVAPRIASPRAEVAHTIAYRRRKGTVVVLEQLARDVTGWNANTVESFQRLVTTQYMNHLRPRCWATPDLRQWEPLERIGTAFDSIARTIDVRRIASQRGRYNIPNVGIFLWRIDAYPASRSPATQVDARRWRFHPLNIDQPLYTRPQTEDEITQLATPLNVPEPIGRRVLDARLSDYYTGPDNIIKSLRLYEVSAGTFHPVAPDAICVCNLADDGAGWTHLPPTGKKYAIDPVLGRIASSDPLPAGTRVATDFHYGFSADLGGGEYERVASFASTEAPPQLLRVPNDFPTIAAALTALGGAGVVEITDSGRYEETLNINVNANARVELRAANNQRRAGACRRRGLRNPPQWPADCGPAAPRGRQCGEWAGQATPQPLHARSGIAAGSGLRAAIPGSAEPYRRIGEPRHCNRAHDRRRPAGRRPRKRQRERKHHRRDGDDAGRLCRAGRGRSRRGAEPRCLYGDRQAARGEPAAGHEFDPAREPDERRSVDRPGDRRAPAGRLRAIQLCAGYRARTVPLPVPTGIRGFA